MPDILAIERVSFDVQWDEHDFMRTLKHRNAAMLVAEHFGVAGFAVRRLHKATCDILNFAVHPSCRREGAGAALIACLAKRGRPLTATVREANLTAQMFFRSQGFKVNSILRRHYGDEDGYLFQRCMHEEAVP